VGHLLNDLFEFFESSGIDPGNGIALRLASALTTPQPSAPAPVERAEPVAWQRADRPDRILTKLYQRSVAEIDSGVEFIPLYTAPQPAAPAPDVAGLVEALEIIRDWSAFPETGETWDSGKPMSYGACYGSIGERDFMRNVAAQAIAAHQSGGAK